jgi:peptide/nickel transport system permease protein
VLAVKVEDFVKAARAVGNPRWRIALRHILPNEGRDQGLHLAIRC